MRHSNLAVCWTKALISATIASCAVGCAKHDEADSFRRLKSLRTTAATAINTYFVSIQPGAAVTNSRSITFEFASNFSDAQFVCALNDEDPVFCHSPKSYNNLRDGDYRFRVYAKSPTGGMDAAGVTHSWRVDTVPPSTSLAATFLSTHSILFALSSSELNSTYQCTIDANPAAPCSSPLTVQGLTAGMHYFKAQAIDEAGNLDPNGADYNFEFTNEIPITTQITKINPAAPYTNRTDMQIEFESNHSNATFVCSLNGAALSSCASPKAYQNLIEGTYMFKVHAINSFGAQDPTGAAYSWSVDTTPARGQLTKIDATSTSITITWTTNEPATTRLFWGVSPNITREIADDGIAKTLHSVRLTGLSSNTVYTIEPAGQDRAGNPHRMARFTARTLR